jgi:hypothetical protein
MELELHKEELNALYSVSNSIGVTKKKEAVDGACDTYVREEKCL